MPTADRSLDRETRFIAHLESLKEKGDRGALAALRKGLGRPPGEVPETYPYVLPWLTESIRGWPESVYFIVASLFAWHQGSWKGSEEAAPTNLGASLARLAGKKGEDGREGIERRVVALLDTHRDDLADHLRPIVGLLRSGEIEIDWLKLLRDIRWWDAPSRRVQREWARAYWGNYRADQPEQ